MGFFIMFRGIKQLESSALLSFISACISGVHLFGGDCVCLVQVAALYYPKLSGNPCLWNHRISRKQDITGFLISCGGGAHAQAKRWDFYEQAFSLWFFLFLGCTCTLTPRSRESNCWSRWCPLKKSNSPTTSWISTATWVAPLVGKGKGTATGELLACTTGINLRQRDRNGERLPWPPPFLASPSYRRGGGRCVKLKHVGF